MIEPIGWLRTLQFVATDACVTPRCRGRRSSSSFSRKKQTRVWEDECVRAPLLFLYNVLLNSEYKFLWVAWWCVREVPRDRFNASEKKTSLELDTRLFLSNAPLTVRYVYNGASYCMYIAVLPPFRFIGLNSKISPTMMVSGGIFFVVCKSTQLMLLFSLHLEVWTCDGEQPNWAL